MTVRSLKHRTILLMAVLFCVQQSPAQVYNEYGGPSTALSVAQEAPSRVSGCPPVLKTLINQDKENSLFILNSQFATCQGYLNTDKPNAGLFVDGKNLNAAMSNSVTEFNGSLKSAADACSTNKLTNREDQKEMVSKIYYSQTRLADGERGAIQSTATLGAILGKDDWKKNLACESAASQSTKDLCKKAKDPANCKKPTSVHDLYLLQMQVEDKIGQYNLQKKLLTEQLNSMSRSDPAALAAVHDKIVEADVMMAREKAKIPWVDDPVYQSNVSCGRSTGCHNQEAAIAAQLDADYKALQSSYSKMDKASQCLSDNAPYECQVSDVRDAMDLTPSNYSAKVIPGKGQTSAAVNEHFSEQQCMYDARSDQMAAKSTIRSAMVEAGMGLVTLGAGAAVEGAMWAVREGAITTRIARAVVTADRAINAASDTVGAMTNIKNAVDTCTKQQAVGQSGQSAGKDNKGGDICSQNAIFSFSPANDQFGDCMDSLLEVLPPGQVAKAGLKAAQAVKSGTAAAMRAVGYTPANTPAVKNYFKSVQDFDSVAISGKVSATTGSAAALEVKATMLQSAANLSTADRWAAAESITGVPLTPMQKLAIVDAHNVGEAAGHGFDTYTPEEFRQKIQILKAAGFKQDEIDRMMRTGVTGALAKTSVNDSYINIARQIKQNTERATDANSYRLRAEAMHTLSESPEKVQATYAKAAEAYMKENKIVVDPKINIVSPNAEMPNALKFYRDQLKPFDSMRGIEKSNVAEAMIKSGNKDLAPQAALILESRFQGEMHLDGKILSDFKGNGGSFPEIQKDYIINRWTQTLDSMTPQDRAIILPQITRIWPAFRYAAP